MPLLGTPTAYLGQVRGHSFHGQELGVERAGEKVLQGANLIPPTLRHSLCDTHLQPSDFASGQVPIDLGPFRRVVSGCTGRSRLLLSHPRRSPDSLAMEHLSDVGTRFAEVVGA